MNIPRYLEKEILAKIQPKKVVVLYGPRQVGKTTLLKKILTEVNEPYVYLSGEDRNIQSWLSSQSIEVLKENIGKNKLIAIDEAQKISNIGLNLKLIVDHLEDVKVIATGSSSFELAQQVGEPLVGRKWQYILYPVAQIELNEMENPYESKERLLTRLVFGSYPAVVTADDLNTKKEILNSIVDNALYRDLLNFQDIRRAGKIIDILKMIAFQIGYEVSMNEIGKALGLNLRTVEKYLDLLEKVFVLKRVAGFSRNLRSEITKNQRFYFYDNGIRNAVINNFNDIETRNDIGQLWENYLFMERLKKQEYHKIYANNYFWRTYDHKEIDLVEERDGKLFGYEFKWGDKKVKSVKLWKETYPNAEYEVVTRENYMGFIT